MLRTIFAKRKRRKLKARKMPLESICLKRLQLRKQSREGTQCCATSCIQNSSDDFLRQVAKWQQAWTVTPRAQKQSALLQHVRAHVGADVPKEVGTCEHDNSKQLLLQLPASTRTTCTSKWPFLGQKICEAGFRLFSGISHNCMSSARKQAKHGFCTFVGEKSAIGQPRLCHKWPTQFG